MCAILKDAKKDHEKTHKELLMKEANNIDGINNKPVVEVNDFIKDGIKMQEMNFNNNPNFVNINYNNFNMEQNSKINKFNNYNQMDNNQ